MARILTTAAASRRAPFELPGQTIRRDSLSVYDRQDRGEMARQAKVAAFLKQSKDRWRTADAASSSFRSKMRIDQKFANGGGAQWDPVDRQQRADEGRPCLEINRIPQFIRQVSNQNRMNRSQIQVSPRGGGAVREHAWAVQGLIRSIEVESDADVVYDTATDRQLVNGLGFVRLKVAWQDKLKGIRRVCRLSRVRNPLSVYWDPSVQDADFGDMRYAHVIGVIGKDEYDARWGDVQSYATLSEFMRTDSSLSDWAPEGKVVLAEYFYVTTERRVYLQLEDGTELWQDELATFQHAWGAQAPGQPMPRVQLQRPIDLPTVRWALHNGVEILEGNADRTAGRRLPGTRIPLFPVVGDEVDLDGTVDYKGMVRDAIDPVRMLNFWDSSIAEAVALAPKAPWIAAAGQVAQYIDDWKVANRVPLSLLQYDPKTVDGNLVPAPQRLIAEPAIQAMVVGRNLSDTELKAVMGLFEPSLGERGPQQSGKAITAMQQQGQIANSNYLDNLQRTKRSIGRTLVNEWLAEVYDVATLMHLEMPNGKKKQVVLYAGQQNAPQPGDFPPDITEFYDLSVGEFEVEVNSGPSFETQRQATEAWLLDLFKVVPQLAPLGVDILLENSDNPAAQQLAERFKTTLPPQFQDEATQAAKIPQLLGQLKQAQQHAAIAHQLIVKMSNIIDKEQISAQAKIEVAAIQARATVSAALIKAGDARESQALDHAADHFSQVLDAVTEAAQSDVTHAQTLEQQGAAAAQDQTTQAQGADQASALAAQQAGHSADLAQQQAALAPPPAAPAGAP